MVNQPSHTGMYLRCRDDAQCWVVQKPIALSDNFRDDAIAGLLETALNVLKECVERNIKIGE